MDEIAKRLNAIKHMRQKNKTKKEKCGNGFAALPQSFITINIAKTVARHNALGEPGVIGYQRPSINVPDVTLVLFQLIDVISGLLF